VNYQKFFFIAPYFIHLQKLYRRRMQNNLKRDITTNEIWVKSAYRFSRNFKLLFSGFRAGDTLKWNRKLSLCINDLWKRLNLMRP